MFITVYNIKIMKEYLIILLSIFFSISIYGFYILGKVKQENKQYKNNNKLQKKINKIKKIDKKELINKLKKGKFILLFSLLLNGCCSGLNNNLYIPLQQYTEQEQKDLAGFLENNNVEIVDRIIIDYWELREIARIVNKN